MQLGLGNSLVKSGLSNPDKLSLDLNFAAGKTLTARKGPAPVFTRGTNATYVGSDGLIKTTTGVNDARFDHDPTTLASRGLLIEELRENQTKRSDGSFSNAYWNTTASNNTTAVDNVVVSPTGATNASTLTEIAGTNVLRHIHQQTGEFVPVADSDYSMSVWVKRPTSNAIQYIQLAFWISGFGAQAYINFDIQNGSIGTGGTNIKDPSIVAYPNGWYRISAVSTSIASPASSGFQMGFSTASNAVRTQLYTASAPLKSIQMWGAQIEKGSLPTSYIPTTTTGTAARSADVCSITGSNFSSFYNQSEGTIVSKVSRLDSSNLTTFGRRLYTVNDGTASNELGSTFDATHNANVGGTTIFSTSGAEDGIYPGKDYSSVFAYKILQFHMQHLRIQR